MGMALEGVALVSNLSVFLSLNDVNQTSLITPRRRKWWGVFTRYVCGWGKKNKERKKREAEEGRCSLYRGEVIREMSRSVATPTRIIWKRKEATTLRK